MFIDPDGRSAVGGLGVVFGVLTAIMPLWAWGLVFGGVFVLGLAVRFLAVPVATWAMGVIDNIRGGISGDSFWHRFLNAGEWALNVLIDYHILFSNILFIASGVGLLFIAAVAIFGNPSDGFWGSGEISPVWSGRRRDNRAAVTNIRAYDQGGRRLRGDCGWRAVSLLENVWITNPITGAANLQAFLQANNVPLPTTASTTDRISVSVSGNNISIVTGFTYSVTGNTPADQWTRNHPNEAITYQNLFENSIRNAWGGTYTVFGYRVTVTVTINNNRPNRLNAVMRGFASTANGTVGPTTTQSGIIWMSTHASSGPLRNQANFRNVAAHEFGHNLGLTHPDNQTSSHSVSGSIMRYAGHNTASNIDIERVIKAYATGARWMFDIP